MSSRACRGPFREFCRANRSSRSRRHRLDEDSATPPRPDSATPLSVSNAPTNAGKKRRSRKSRLSTTWAVWPVDSRTRPGNSNAKWRWKRADRDTDPRESATPFRPEPNKPFKPSRPPGMNQTDGKNSFWENPKTKKLPRRNSPAPRLW